MALSGTDRGSGGNNTGATSIVITPGSNFTAGSYAVLCLAYDNNGSNGADPFSSITDSVGNTWISRQAALYDPGNASAGITLRIFSSPMLTAALTTGNTITVNFNAATVAKSWALHEVTCASGNIVRFISSGVNTGAASATPTVTTGSITSGDLVIGAGASESSDTWAGDADSSNGSWSVHQHNVAGSGTSGAAVTSQRKIVSGTATQTYNPTLTSADVILAWVQFREVDSSLEAASGSFSLTGQAANFVRGKIMAANSGSFSESGQSANLLFKRKLAASIGSVSESGQTVNLSKGYKVSADSGSFSETGQSIGLRVQRKISAAIGSLIQTGIAASLLFAHVMASGQGTVNETGQSVGLRQGKIISVESGSIVQTGQSVQLTYSPVGNTTLSVEQGVFNLSGSDIDLRVSSGLSLAANSGSYSLDGQDVAFTLGRETRQARMITKILYKTRRYPR